MRDIALRTITVLAGGWFRLVDLARHAARIPASTFGLSSVFAKFPGRFTEPTTESAAEFRRANIPKLLCDCLDGHARSEQAPLGRFLAGVVEKPPLGHSLLLELARQCPGAMFSSCAIACTPG
jgi:hypothetical protein